MSIDISEPSAIVVAQHIERPLEEVETVTIRFTGDSGDGMRANGKAVSSTTMLLIISLKEGCARTVCFISNTVSLCYSGKIKIKEYE